MAAENCEEEEAQHCMTFIQLNGEALISLRVKPGDRVDDLMKLVRDALGLGKRFCTLVLDGHELQPMSALAESDLKAGDSTVTVVISTPAQLKDAGHTPWELRRCGYTASELKDAGYSEKELMTPEQHKNAGHTPWELRKVYGFTAQELKDAGYNLVELRVAHCPAQVLIDSLATEAGLYGLLSIGQCGSFRLRKHQQRQASFPTRGFFACQLLLCIPLYILVNSFSSASFL